MVDREDAPLVIGVDIATQHVRALCCDAHGAVRVAAERPLPAVRRVGLGESEQDAQSWWPAVLACLRETTVELGRTAGSVRALSVCATSGTVVLVDSDGIPVGPALMYDDRRGGEFAAAADTAARARWEALGVHHGPTSTTGRIAWLLRHAPPPATLVCHAPDLVTWRLVGRRTPSDWSHALKSGFDPLRGEWAGEAYAALDVPLGRLPGVLAPATEVGTVDSAVAAAAGLPASCAVRLGMTDGCAGQIACGAVRPGTAVTVLGTTLVVKAASRDLVTDPSGAVYSHRGPDGTWFPGGASNTGGEALAAHTAEDLTALDGAAERRGESSVVRYPLRREGERFPFVAPEARGFTLGTPADRVDAYRADLEGVALIERLGYEHLGRLGVTVGDEIRTAGGGSRSDLWLRIRASALRRPLRRVRRGDTAFGAAVLAATGTLHPDLRSAVHAMVHRDDAHDVIEPYPAWSDQLDECYRRLHAELERRGYLATPAPTAAGD